ncbi:MAG: adenosylcobalamin-dependent ribonucleoside-diphosphate reductase [Candidatus Levybacteria bacterium]|nr:adenosylcobalamin-dependent ribonucleoside-diphosphate reductase [Candidatus Levybacteria bacterium]
MKLDGIREKVFLDRYALKAPDGSRIENTPEETWARVASGIAKNEKGKVRKKWEKSFYNVMSDFKFVPGGRILSGAGTDYQVTYFNCFVIPSPKDSREGILESLKQLVEIQSRSGGVGLNLSSLRPKGARVRKVNGTSSGPVTWAGLFSYATHDVVQQGGTRRGATMLMLWDWHPDIEEFITVKQDLSKINGANLSVCISDAFMEAVKNDADWDLVYPDIEDSEYDMKWNGEIDQWKALGKKVTVYKTVKARELWDLICTAAWRSAEPGLHFLERSNKRSNTWYFERLLATNPCGEQPLGAWAVCNLGAMNLSAYVKGEDLEKEIAGKFDYESFGHDVKVAMRFLDNVIDQTYYFFKENEKCAKEIRRTGLGIMGLGDALIKMKVRYGSEESVKVLEKIFSTLRNNAYESSVAIAKEKGAFPKFEKKKYLQGYHIKQLPKHIRDGIAHYGIRNAVLLTIAPTGTTSLVAGVSSGVEPVYEFSFLRRWRGGEEIVYHPLFDEWRKAHPQQEKPDYFCSANDLTPLDHARVQAIAQEYIDSSISKTVNAPNSHTVEDVKTLYMAAYDMGLKGVTYMRDGSRQGVLERVDEKKKDVSAHSVSSVQEQPHQPALPVIMPMLSRPQRLSGATYEVETPIGHTFITINQTETEEPFEVFMTVGKGGSDVAAMTEALGRMISLNLRINSILPARERLRYIIGQLTGIGGARSVGFGINKVRSLPDAVARVLSNHFGFAVNGKVVDKKTIEEVMAAPVPMSSVTEANVASIAKEESTSALSNGHGVTNGHSNGSAKQIDAQVQSDTVQQLTLEAAENLSTTNLYDICPECGSATFAYEEGCKKCYGCGYSEC